MDNKLRELQLREVWILDEVVKICERHNFVYYLHAGTLLGAVRHKGFIPWDDDLDIAMPQRDYDAFCRVAQEELPSSCFLQTKHTETNYPDPIARVRDTNTYYANEFAERFKYKHHGVWVDIYPLRGMDWPSLTGLLQIFSKEVITRIVYHRAFKDLKGLSATHKLIHYCSCILPLKTWISIRDFFAECNHSEHPGYYVIVVNPYNFARNHYKRIYFGTPIKILFEGKEYNAPADPDAVLKITYGDYMQLPPVEKRINHSPKDWDRKEP